MQSNVAIHIRSDHIVRQTTLIVSYDEKIIYYDDKPQFFLVVLPWALLTNKWYYYQDDLINLGIPARLQSGYDTFSDMLADWFSCPCFFPFLLSKAPLDPIETLISKVADYLMYWKNSSVENWLEKTTTTPNYATWNTNELFSVPALANAMSRFRLEFGVNKHL